MVNDTSIAMGPGSAMWLFLGMLSVAACSPHQPSSSATGPVRPAPPASAVGASASHDQVAPAGAAEAASAADAATLERIVSGALEASEHPAAAVVFDARGRLLVAQGRRGADPSLQAWRPGSTLKPLLTQIAARRGVIAADVHFDCQETYAPIEGFQCFGKHGDLGLVDAVRTSCNTFFFDVVRRTGLEAIRDGFVGYGFTRKTGLVAEESPGEIPDDAALAHARSEPGSTKPWPGFALLIGTGHGPIQVTLLQLTRAYVTLADELTREAGASEAGGVSTANPPRAARDGAAASSASDAKGAERPTVGNELLAGMIAAVGPGGTAEAAQVQGLRIAGKTGTAEPGRHSDAPGGTLAENGWFVGFAPADAPEVVVGVVVLGGGGAGKSAVPLAGTIFREWSRGRHAKDE